MSPRLWHVNMLPIQLEQERRGEFGGVRNHPIFTYKSGSTTLFLIVEGWHMLRGWVPVLMLAAAIVQAQQDSPEPPAAGELSIPAELTTTVRAENAHRGDPVQFRTLEPVLIANGLVMPANAKLSGRIVGAAPQQGDKPSWLVLLVEKAEWKQQSVPLHAFIASQIAISSVPLQSSQPADLMPGTSSPRRPRRESARADAHDGIDASSSTMTPQDAREVSQQSPGARTVPLKDLRIVRDKEGIAYLFSSKSNVKLPSGTLFMLRNQATPGLGSSTGDSDSASHNRQR